MAALEVGKPYVPGRTSIEPRVEYSFRRGQHELLLCFSQLSEDEIDAVGEGKAEFGLLIYGLVIFLLYRFGEAIAWSDAPYSWHAYLQNSDSYRRHRRPPKAARGSAWCSWMPIGMWCARSAEGCSRQTLPARYMRLSPTKRQGRGTLRISTLICAARTSLGPQRHRC